MSIQCVSRPSLRIFANLPIQQHQRANGPATAQPFRSTMISHPLPRRHVTASFVAIVIAFIAAFGSTSAQTTGTISGIVRDARTRAPLVAATVALRDQSDTTARSLGDLTDATGAFAIERVPIGKSYSVAVTFLGYETHRISSVALSADKSDLNLGEIS